MQGKDRLHVLKATLAKNEWTEDFSKTVAEDRAPWSSCPRDAKLLSFAKLPDLLSALAARVEEISSQTNRTVEMVRSLIDAMRQPHQKRELAPVAAPNDDDIVADDLDLNRDVPLRELTASVAPTLFKRPRAKSSLA